MNTILEQSNQLGESVRTICSSVNIRKISAFLADEMIQIDIENFDATALGIESKSGLYYFHANFENSEYVSFESFGCSWGKSRGAHKGPKDCPRFYSARAKKHPEITDKKDIPFYLGKSEDLNVRLDLHVNDIITSTTYGLKLKARSELLKSVTLTLGVVYLDLAKDSLFMLEKFESLIRSNINPIIGKQ